MKETLHLLTLHVKIRENKEFYMRLLAFIKYIIKCSAKNDVPSNILHYTCFNEYKTNITKDFMAHFKENSKAIVKKVQMHSPMYNPTCYRYNINQSKVCKFDFLRPKILAPHIDYNRLIQLK